MLEYQKSCNLISRRIENDRRGDAQKSIVIVKLISILKTVVAYVNKQMFNYFETTVLIAITFSPERGACINQPLIR